jgi:glycosyltransferase involved in cell wall biosynthesis
MIPPVAHVKCAFVMEQTLGHVTHARNLRDIAAEYGDVEPVWLPIPFETRGVGRLVPIFSQNWSVRASWRARRALSHALARIPLDAALFHTQVTSLFSVGMMQRVPSVISLDATPINYDSVGRYYGHRAASDGFLDRQKLARNRRAFHAATHLVTWSDWARRSLVADYGVDAGRVSVLAPGASAAYFEVGRRRAADRATGPRADGKAAVLPRVLFVGGDFARKGGPDLLEVVGTALRDRCELHVVTNAPVEPRPHVRVHRGIGPNDPALVRLFAEADIFVLPSRAECLAIVLMEATAAALPVITTDVGALSEAVRPGDTGLVIRAGDRSDLARALDALIGDPAARHRMGLAGHELARLKFDARTNGRALLDIVVEAAQQGRHTRGAA